MHGAHGVGRLIDGHRDRIGLVVANQVADVAVERGGEQHRLVAAVAVTKDPLDLRREAVVGHPIGLVERDDLHVVERHLVRLDQIDQAQRRGDHDLDALGQFIDLVVAGGAAVDGQHPHAGVMGDGLEDLGDLDGEFAGRNEHESERTRRLRLVGDPRQHRHAECEGLARAGLRTAADVLAGDGDRNRLGLDVERLGEPTGCETVVDPGRNAEIEESRRGFHRGQDVEGGEVRGVDVAAVVRLVRWTRSLATRRSPSRC